MKLPNPITDHGLTLPDICDFPDAGDPLFPADLDYAPYQAEIYKAFATYNQGMFDKAYGTLVSEITKRYRLNSTEKAILNEQTGRVKQAVANYFDSCRRQVERNDIPTSEMYESINETGAYGLKLDQTDIDTLNTILADDIAELKKIGNTTNTPHYYDRAKNFTSGNVIRVLTNIFHDRGILQAATKYNRNQKNMSIYSAALHIARPTDTHHYTTLRDLPTTSKTVSYHMDPKYNVVKSLVYLNDVGIDNGPFMTIPTSNHWQYPEVERVVANGNSTGNYLNTPAHRKVLRLFPRELRKNVILGRYKLDGTAEQDILLNNSNPFTTDQHNCIVFDPTLTLHRGGLCKTGERINLQIVMR